MSTPVPFRIGLISDTHGLYDPAVGRHFANMHCIIHAGDIGNCAVVEALQQWAPVIAVSGNIDGRSSTFPPEVVIQAAGRRIAVRHHMYAAGRLTSDGRDFLNRTRPDICIFGHSHQPKIDHVGHTLMINPGSAGPPRFALPRGIGILELRKASVCPMLISLGNPGRAAGRVKKGPRKRP